MVNKMQKVTGVPPNLTPDQVEAWEDATQEWNDPNPDVRLGATERKMVEHLRLIERHEVDIEKHRRAFSGLNRRYDFISAEIGGE